MKHLAEPLAHAARVAAQALAVVDGPRRVDYATLQQLAMGMARHLRTQGLQPGQRVLLHLDKSLEAVVAFYGCWIAGGVVVQASSVLRSPQVEHLARHAEVAQLWTVPRLASRLDAEFLAEYPAQNMAAQLELLWQQLGQSEERSLKVGSGTELAALLYTSGSTGLPKGIMLSHENLLAGARIVCDYLGLRGDDRLLSVVPFSFDYGLNQLLDAVHCQATLVLQRSPLPADVCRSLKQHSISVLAGVPPFWIQLMQGRSPFPQQTFPDLRLMTSTGGVFPADLVERYRQHSPQADVVKMYGLTEAFRSTYLPPNQLAERPHSMGKAIPECTLLVLDENDQPCPIGVPGQLVHRGPTVAQGYWRDEGATNACFRPDPEPENAVTDGDGKPRPVVYSGDQVIADEEGYLSFIARMDDLIKSLGYRISPTEVEQLARQSGQVQDAVATGISDPDKGAVIRLHVLPSHQDRFSEEELRGYFRDHAPRYLWPAEIVTHQHFPQTPNGKVDRRAVLDVTSC